MSNTRPFLWLHIKKAAGTSAKRALDGAYVPMTGKRLLTSPEGRSEVHANPFARWPREQWNDCLNNYRIPLAEYDFRRMLFARQVLYSAEEFSAIYKFAVVRNPYDRIVSAWYSCAHRLSLLRLRQLRARLSFESFLDYLPEAWETRGEGNSRHVAMHTAPIWPDVTDEDGSLLLDQVVRLENIECEFARVGEVLDLPQRAFPHLNRGRRGRAWRNVYSRRSRALVERYYRDDIERFGYEF